jgi:hypothetical protein
MQYSQPTRLAFLGLRRFFCRPENKAMQVNTETINDMLKDYKKPDDVLVENGLLKQLTKALLQYALTP